MQPEPKTLLFTTAPRRFEGTFQSQNNLMVPHTARGSHVTTLTRTPLSTENLNLVTLRAKVADYHSSGRSNEARGEPRWEASAPNTHQVKKEKCKKSKTSNIAHHKRSEGTRTEATADIYELLQKLHSYDKEKECGDALTQVYQATGSGSGSAQSSAR